MRLTARKHHPKTILDAHLISIRVLQPTSVFT